jgi:hypothetical protein
MIDGDSKQGPIIERRFACSCCGQEAGDVRLFGPRGDAKLVRSSFTSQRTCSIADTEFELIRSHIATGDIGALYGFDAEIASFYCPRCNASYCGRHWAYWDVFDDGDGFRWHDSIHGRCLQGHERILED